MKVDTRAATYHVTIVERQEMKQDLVANADALKGSLARTGHVEVVAWLTGKLSVDGKRLVPHGVGPCAPVASNATDEGRVKNPRLELVEIR